MKTKALRRGQILIGPIFNEPMRVETTEDGGGNIWVVGLVGLRTERFRKVTLTQRDVEKLMIQENLYSYC